MDVAFQKQLIEISRKHADAEKSDNSFKKLMTDQADRLQAELDKYESENPVCSDAPSVKSSRKPTKSKSKSSPKPAPKSTPTKSSSTKVPKPSKAKVRKSSRK